MSYLYWLQINQMLHRELFNWTNGVFDLYSSFIVPKPRKNKLIAELVGEHVFYQD